MEPLKRFYWRTDSIPLRTKAEAVLVVLMERRKQENNASSLLRGSSAPSVTPNELLCAAYPATELAPELLLRPACGTQNEE